MQITSPIIELLIIGGLRISGSVMIERGRISSSLGALIPL